MRTKSTRQLTPKLLNPDEAAEIYRVSKGYLKKYHDAGELPAVKRGKLVRYAVKDLDAFFKSSFAKRKGPAAQ